MADGKLIIEVYEYNGESARTPSFEYTPCALEKCFKHNRATLKEIIQRGLAHRPEAMKEILRKIEEAGFDRIAVLYNKATNANEAYIELTNVVQVSMADADASRKKKKGRDDIILYGKYRLSDGTETTKLKDAQRLSLIYSAAPEDIAEADMEDAELQKEICLNITFMQE